MKKTNVGIQLSNNTWSLDNNSDNPAYKVSVSVTKETITSYSALTVGTVTREVTEKEEIYVLGDTITNPETGEKFPDPTLEKVYLRVKYEDTISSASVTGPVKKTVDTTYTYNITMQKKNNSNWWCRQRFR
jgi:hypothetical protein